MIKTTELMLGNIIEHDGKYHVVERIGKADISVSVGNISSDYINPIPLTEVVLKRLKEDLTIGYKSVHEFQVARYKNPLDITPLLSPRYTTHDGVEVWEEDLVWRCKIENPTNLWRHAINKNSPSDCYSFSTQQACQSYIDKVTRKPIFTTEDGVDVFEGDEYYATSISGYDKYGYEAIVDKIKVPKVWEGDDTKVRFANKETAKKYLQWVLTKSQAEKAEAEYQSLLNTKK